MFSLYFTCEFARQKTKKTDILVLMKLCTLKRIFLWVGLMIHTQKEEYMLVYL